VFCPMAATRTSAQDRVRTSKNRRHFRQFDRGMSMLSEMGNRPSTIDPNVVEMPKNSVVYHQGDRVQHWFEVVAGTVRTCRFHFDGHRQLTGFYFTHDIFGIDGETHLNSAEAVTDIVIRRQTPDHETKNGAGGPGVLDAGHVLERALGSAHECIHLLGHRTAPTRTAAFLLSLARRPGPSGRVELPMSRLDIADYLGLTIHTVSRTISDFARQRIIALDGRQSLHILDRDKLAEIAGVTINDNLRKGE
jgi:CRP/FNR family transcriptional regulator, nitrogen fixation regulation protein